ncbi:hypothetical protein RJT34_16417 [Clitoria ternatea]|uniref:Uncharacterized protein n=1 Tax=Clitoria ternatea TaxID=43366 RepID=A0AAN9J8B2_CLITE
MVGANLSTLTYWSRSEIECNTRREWSIGALGLVSDLVLSCFQREHERMASVGMFATWKVDKSEYGRSWSCVTCRNASSLELHSRCCTSQHETLA